MNIRGRGIGVAVGVGAVVLALAAGDAERAQAAACKPAEAQCAARLTVKIKGKGKSRKGSLRKTGIGRQVRVRGTIRPYVARQKLVVRLRVRGKTALKRTVKVKRGKRGKVGTFRVKSKPLATAGPYRAVVRHLSTPVQAPATKRTPKLKITFPRVGSGTSGQQVRVFQRLLRKQGYYTPVNGRFDDGTKRAVMAFRKVNRMGRNFSATAGIFRSLARGKGGYEVRFPKNGRHVESDLSRQIMVLVDKGRARHIFHISSGAPSTPTIRGNFRFYRYEPGYNSLGMYYSVYYQGGYAIHGYKSVPTYPASHGCLRNPIPDSRFIYDWVSIGMPINIY